MTTVSKANAEDIINHFLSKLDRKLRSLEDSSKDQQNDLKTLKKNCEKMNKDTQSLGYHDDNQQFSLNSSISTNLRMYIKGKYSGVEAAKSPRLIHSARYQSETLDSSHQNQSVPSISAFNSNRETENILLSARIDNISSIHDVDAKKQTIKTKNTPDKISKLTTPSNKENFQKSRKLSLTTPTEKRSMSRLKITSALLSPNISLGLSATSIHN